MDRNSASPPDVMGEKDVYSRLQGKYGVGLARAVMRTYKRLMKHGGYSHWDHVSDNYLDIGGEWNHDHLIALQLAGVPIPARGEVEAGKKYYYWFNNGAGGNRATGSTLGMQGPLGLTVEDAQRRSPSNVLSEPRFSGRKPWMKFNIQE
jgi:hypothetical protein